MIAKSPVANNHTFTAKMEFKNGAKRSTTITAYGSSEAKAEERARADLSARFPGAISIVLKPIW
jgi:hypothetical protein